MRTVAAALVAAALVAASSTACARTTEGVGRRGSPLTPPGTSSAPSGRPPSDAEVASASAAFDRQAKQVAQRWSATDHGDAWRNGFVPLQDLTVLPAGLSEATRQTIVFAGSLLMVSRLPASPGTGRIAFPGGGTMTVPLQPAQFAYRQLADGHPMTCPLTPKVPTGPLPPAPAPTGPNAQPTEPNAEPTGTVATSPPSVCRTYHVTHVELGTTNLWTSRGLATVPAWLFTFDTLPGPIARVAVAESAIAQPPTGPTAPDSRDIAEHHVAGAERIASIDGTTIRFYAVVSPCDTTTRPLVYEDARTVVLGVFSYGTATVCVAMAKIVTLTVRLGAPAGTRAILDVSTGDALQIRNAP
ncbi:MAG TPA: hypothetical protein VFR11_07780 [Micromonosporaceae bacterium]|nr:hypothetical protein [Micromonosporaceae bacterium]